jgi:hypothetical protein
MVISAIAPLGIYFAMVVTPILPNFAIRPATPLCMEVLDRGLTDFRQLAEYVRALPYDRISDTANPALVLREECGTCSFKHQLLVVIAHDCDHSEFQLTVGIYAMSEQNTPGVRAALNSTAFSSIPEAHCYLTVSGDRFDFTGLSSGSSSPFDALIAEHIVSPEELPTMKLELHMRALGTWANRAGISTAAAWTIREACISALKHRALSSQ